MYIYLCTYIYVQLASVTCDKDDEKGLTTFRGSNCCAHLATEPPHFQNNSNKAEK